jgi:glycerol-3-phosphate dehydrogenase
MSLIDLPKIWDLIVIGGGITGAGIFREASRAGLKVVLVEQKDFAWGTSSRSSKLVHGGLRYLREGHFLMTKIAVEERERLLKEAPGLVESLGFWLPIYEEQRPGKRTMQVGLSLYDIMARERQHRWYDADSFLQMVPYIEPSGLTGGFHFMDAQVDDSRLVLRLINEAVTSGAYALNYTAAHRIIRDKGLQVAGVEVEDVESRERTNFFSPAVINATGSWAEKLHPAPETHLHLRPLRGSHMVFPADVLPLTEGLTFMHPLDNRAVFAIPWEGAVLVGTTDLDHPQDLSIEPNITEAEVSYLMDGIQAIFPSLNISRRDCLCAFAGIRPVLSEGKLKPSQESREHVVWVDQGLVTVTGGKLTTFRRLAMDALKAAKSYLPSGKVLDRKASVFDNVPEMPAQDYGLSPQTWRRLYGRYGRAADTIVCSSAPEDLAVISGTQTLWAELPYVAAHEQIRHLGDLLLRRVRIGLLTPEGGKAYLKRIHKLCKEVLPWDRRRWKAEIRMYLVQWNHAHALPVRRARIMAKHKIISFRGLAAALSTIYRKVGPTKKKRPPA